MQEHLHRTDTLNSCKAVTFGVQKQHWVEFQLLDEQGKPLVNMPFRAVNDATRAGCVPVFEGQSDEQGVIRLEGLHPLPITLLMEADPFAKELQCRPLRAQREEPPRPGFGENGKLYEAQRSGFSPLESQARESGYEYHYLRIGQLCDALPKTNPPMLDERDVPLYHFPDKNYSGCTFVYDQLNRRHVLEVCPFRSWSLLLHYQAEYSIVNAYNLGLMSVLSYSRKDEESFGSVDDFFLRQCSDLSRTPKVSDNGQIWPCLVVDVPFDERYIHVRALDTKKLEPPRGDTQLFYAINASHVLVAWRGTASLEHVITDLAFRPVEPSQQRACAPAVKCEKLVSVGKVHLGFRDAFNLAKEIYAYDFKELISHHAQTKKLFICGHSLGGALGLVHAAEQKKGRPLLYTYGMPRAFTLRAVMAIEEVIHFRHVNEKDPVPSVPPDVPLDNRLYDIHDTWGGVLGFGWSLYQWTASDLVRVGDPFAHHGEVVAFMTAVQHAEERGLRYPSYRSKASADNPYYTIISRRLPEKVKLYLVPSLSAEVDAVIESTQRKFIEGMDEGSRNEFFPRKSHPEDTNLMLGLLHGADHFMSNYQPYIHNQLLELISPGRMQHRVVVRERFVKQMEDYYGVIPPVELERNRALIELQAMLEKALRATQKTVGETDAFVRFDAVANSYSCYERTCD
ncbi:lipase family protein [Pseudomonas japonica]|uniref:lipase family protein n=1 Tax=Pseudomonas japonica TaxID=256466 RepID=UPI003826E133